jgi:hypothetical protein
MAEIYEANEEVRDMMVECVRNFHPDLATILEDIAIIFREKASKSGGQVVLGKSKKAPAIVGVLADKDYKFILEIAQDEWAQLMPKQQEALIDHLLCGCGYVIDNDSGKEKIFIKPPDFIGYAGEIKRHGLWRPEVSEAPGNPIEELFGKPKDK